MKKSTAIFLIIILIFSLSTIFSGCNKNNEFHYVLAKDSEDGYATVYKPDDRDLVVLQLTDIHLEYFLTTEESVWNSYGICKDNQSTLSMIDEMLDVTSPDIIVISGDVVRTFFNDNLEVYKRLIDIIEAKEILWMPIFGNHEYEYAFSNKQHTLEEMAEEFQKYPHCLLYQGGCSDGIANYFVNIKDSDENIIYTICGLDCVFDEKYRNGEISDGWSYIKTQSQVEWYENKINEISAMQYEDSSKKVPSMVFMHTPVPEAVFAWEEAWNDGNPNEKYHYGNLLSGKSTLRKLAGQDQFFSKAVELGSTKAIFFGHLHDNDFSIDYQGIRLTAGQMSTNNMDYRISVTLNGVFYTKIDFSRLFTYGDDRGATQININSTSEITISPKYAREILPNYYEEYALNYDEVIQNFIDNNVEIER